MVIYLDLVILSTIVVNTLIILGIECIFNSRVSIVRIIISNVLSVLCLSLYILPIGKFIFIRYLMGILIGIFSFNKCRKENKIIKISLYYLFNISLVGILEIFNIRNMVLLVTATIFIVCLGIVISFRNKDEYVIKLNGKYLNALYDSGNYTFYNGVPVVYLDLKHFNDDYKFVSKITVEVINGKSDVDIFMGPMLRINNKEYFCYFSFSSLNGIDVILHKDIGGVRCLSY